MKTKLPAIIRIYFMLIPAAFLSLAGCDKTEPPYKENNPTGTPSGSLRKILLEDYTGHKCGNCPRAGAKAQSLKNTYGEQLVVISVHAGGYANPTPSGTTMEYDFRTQPGTDLDVFFDISLSAGNPNGMINRIGYPFSHIKSDAAWSSVVDSLAAIPASAEIALFNTNAGGTYNISAKAKFLQAFSGTYKLALYVTEDSIVKPQVDYSLLPSNDTIYNYLHRHVLRDAVNGTWGDTIATGSITPGVEYSKNYVYTPALLWNTAHCAFVAFVYDAATYEVLQAEEQRLAQ